jgi:hypothetical protein
MCGAVRARSTARAWPVAVAAASARLRAGSRGDQGDVPGWVLVTLMTAALVAAIYGIAEDRLTVLLTDALSGVLGDD